MWIRERYPFLMTLNWSRNDWIMPALWAGAVTVAHEEQGKAERIKSFPFSRQYASVNWFDVVISIALLPLGLLEEFKRFGDGFEWATIPFTSLIGWVFLTANRIGAFRENPFAGLHNDVPISSMARGIERDIREMLGETDLPAPREARNSVLF